jgi:hypothetical protein
MSHQEILERAIRKALKNGWDMFLLAHRSWRVIYPHRPCLHIGASAHGADAFHYYPDIIYNHDFAKALWGEDRYIAPDGAISGFSTWQYHLQQMVIAGDPLKYLGEHI